MLIIIPLELLPFAPALVGAVILFSLRGISLPQAGDDTREPVELANKGWLFDGANPYFDERVNG